MRSFSNLGIVLSCVFGVILLGLVAELFYFLWWKKRLNSIEIEGQTENNFPTQLFNFLFCWKTPISAVNSVSNLDINFTTEEANIHKQEEDLELGTSRETLLKGLVEESVEAELIRLHSLCGPPRFLFTIKEETKEELESEDATSGGKGSRTRTRKSLSDLIIAVENTPLTPFPSPPIKIASLEAFDHHGFNPLFESLTEADFIKLRSSPPPKFKFLRDAEEKLFQRLVKESAKRSLRKGDSEVIHSGHSKVLPLATSPSPSTLRPPGLKKSSKK